jgi:hypothetical protein
MSEFEQFIINAQVGFAFFMIAFSVFWRFFVKIDKS